MSDMSIFCICGSDRRNFKQLGKQTADIEEIYYICQKCNEKIVYGVI